MTRAMEIALKTALALADRNKASAGSDGVAPKSSPMESATRPVAISERLEAANLESRASKVPDFAQGVQPLKDTVPTASTKNNRRRSNWPKGFSGGLILPSLLPGAKKQESTKPNRQGYVNLAPRANSPPRYPHLQGPTPRRPAEGPPQVHLAFEANAQLVWKARYDDTLSLLEIDEVSGVPVQLAKEPRGDRELVLGLDFGTSSVKVVLADRTVSKAYAVPFINGVGVSSFLLPSRVFEVEGEFFLNSVTVGAKVYRDLKLRMMSNWADRALQHTVVGFLALVIRRCRSWLFATHFDSYAQRRILWKLVLGRAADRSTRDALSALYESLARAAWVVAGTDGPVTRKTCASASDIAVKSSVDESGTLEVAVVPELAAQIYGFVMSRQFDPKAKNIYLLVDIGAGTVDVSLFRVVPNDLGTVDFSLFTSVVQPSGVMNLHRARIDWWQRQLSKSSTPNAITIKDELGKIKFQTEQSSLIPDQFDGYFNGVNAKFTGGAKSPDQSFFVERLRTQVEGSGMYRPVQDKLIGRADIEGLPFFLCGGGSRLSLYNELDHALRHSSGFSWLKANRWHLGQPKDLIAVGLPQEDYDRLSVAYGLSFVDVGEVSVAKAMPRLRQEKKSNWVENYPGKDQC